MSGTLNMLLQETIAVLLRDQAHLTGKGTKSQSWFSNLPKVTQPIHDGPVTKLGPSIPQPTSLRKNLASESSLNTSILNDIIMGHGFFFF